jgi:hypothetical protein
VIDTAEVEAAILAALDVVDAKIEVEGARGRGGGLRAAGRASRPPLPRAAGRAARPMRRPRPWGCSGTSSCSHGRAASGQSAYRATASGTA